MRKSGGSDDGDIKAFLGESTEFKGILTFEGTVRVDGIFEGEVITKDTLIVGEKASLKANISAGTVIVKGKIAGNITAVNKIEIRSDSEIVGNIKTPSLFIEEGAVFDGKCEMCEKRQQGKDQESNGNQKRKKETAAVT